MLRNQNNYCFVTHIIQLFEIKKKFEFIDVIVYGKEKVDFFKRYNPTEVDTRNN